MHARVLAAVEPLRLLIVRILTTNAGADDAGGAFAKAIGTKIQARLGHCLACRDQGELRDAVEHDQTFGIEMRERIIAAHFGGDLHVEQIGRDIGDRADARAALAHRPPGRCRIMSERTDGAHAGDNYATHGYCTNGLYAVIQTCAAGAAAAFSASSLSTASTRPRTDSVSKFGSRSGRVIL